MGGAAAGDEFGALIPWYANGTLSAGERKNVEDHLATCADCRELVTLVRHQGQIATVSPHEIGMHVESGLLHDYVLEREQLGNDTLAWVEEHMGRCADCGEIASALERLRPDLEGSSDPASLVAHTHLTGVRGWMLRTPPGVLMGIAAACLLAVAVLSVESYRWSQRPETAALLSGQSVVFHALRGPGAEETLGHGIVVLDVALPHETPDDARFAVEIRDRTQSDALSEPLRMGPTRLEGRPYLQFILDTRKLAPGTLDLRVRQVAPVGGAPFSYDASLIVRGAREP